MTDRIKMRNTYKPKVKYWMDVADASKQGIELVKWHEVTEEGQWGVSDDGYAIQCSRIYNYTHPKQERCIHFKGGFYSWIKGGMAKPFYIKHMIEWKEKTKLRNYYEKITDVMFSMIMDDHFIDWDKMGELIYGKNIWYNTKRAKAKINYNKEIQEMLVEKLKQLAIDYGLTPAMYFNDLKEQMEELKSSSPGDAKLEEIRMKVRQEVATLLDLKPDIVKSLGWGEDGPRLAADYQIEEDEEPDRLPEKTNELPEKQEIDIDDEDKEF